MEDDLTVQLEQRLREVFDGAGLSLRVWVRKHFGREVADDLPGLIVSFNVLCYETAACLTRHGHATQALDLLAREDSLGWWVFGLLALSRHALLLSLIVVLLWCVGTPLLTALTVALVLVLVPEVARWWARRGSSLQTVSCLRFLVVGAVASLLLLLQPHLMLPGASAPTSALPSYDTAQSPQAATSTPDDAHLVTPIDSGTSVGHRDTVEARIRYEIPNVELPPPTGAR